MTQNEDFARFRYDESGKIALFAVADGMGNLDYGLIVSRMVVDTILGHMDFLEDNDKKSFILNTLEMADYELEKFCEKNKCRSGVSIAFGLIHDRELTFSWQGNVRIYLNDTRDWNQITSDHILHIGNGKYRLSRCLKGEGLRDDIPVVTIAFGHCNKLIACTDGLYKICSSLDSMENIILSGAFPEDISKPIDDCTGLLIEF